MSSIKVAKSAVKSVVFRKLIVTSDQTIPISGVKDFSSNSRKLTDELEEASNKGDEDTVKCLLERGVKIRCSLHFAALEGHLGTVKILVEHGADIHKMFKNYDRTPVMIAAWKGNLDVTKFLVEKGAFLSENSYHSEWGGVKNAFKDYGFLSNLSSETKKNHKEVLKECLYELMLEKCNILS